MTTKAQEWSQKRNRRKFRLKGAMAAISPHEDATKPSILTREERRLLIEAESLIEIVLDRWEGASDASKERYLRERKGVN